MTVTTKRVKSVFHDDDKTEAGKTLLMKEYKSKRELMEDYGNKKGGLRFRSGV